MLKIGSAFVVVGNSQHRGRGLFACSNIAADTSLGLTPSWELSPDDIKALSFSSIEGYWFDHIERKGWGLLPLGIAALVNHSQSPNAVLEWYWSEEGYIGDLKSICEIERGVEVFIDYQIIPPDDWL
jgi:hypothetical protein